MGERGAGRAGVAEGERNMGQKRRTWARGEEEPRKRAQKRMREGLVEGEGRRAGQKRWGAEMVEEEVERRTGVRRTLAAVVAGTAAVVLAEVASWAVEQHQHFRTVQCRAKEQRRQK